MFLLFFLSGHSVSGIGVVVLLKVEVSATRAEGRGKQPRSFNHHGRAASGSSAVLVCSNFWNSREVFVFVRTGDAERGHKAHVPVEHTERQRVLGWVGLGWRGSSSRG